MDEIGVGSGAGPTPRIRLGIWPGIWLAHGIRLAPRLALLLVGLCATGAPARAQVGSARYSSIVMVAGTGDIVSTVNPDAPRAPASLTKLMTLYMTFEALRDRRIALDQLVPVSPHAASMEPTKLGLLPGMRLTVEQAIEGLVTKSANDAAAALGELLGGGDEARFGQMMTLRARALGMRNTVFRNASGLPDPQQFSTARDLAMLARHLVQDFPAEYHYFSIPSFVFAGHVIPNHDHMLQNYPGADGMKTGYTLVSGFNLVTSAVRGNVRLIGVVLGAAHPAERDQHMAVLLDSAYTQLGVPISPQRPAPSMAGRLGLVASAQAATLPAAHGRTAVVRVGLRHVAVAHRIPLAVRPLAAHHAVRATPSHRTAHAPPKPKARTREAAQHGYVRQASRDAGG